MGEIRSVKGKGNMEEKKKDTYECRVHDCRYNSEKYGCLNKDKRKECIDVAKAVLCIDDVFDDDLK